MICSEVNKNCSSDFKDESPSIGTESRVFIGNEEKTLPIYCFMWGNEGLLLLTSSATADVFL